MNKVLFNNEYYTGNGQSFAYRLKDFNLVPHTS